MNYDGLRSGLSRRLAAHQKSKGLIKDSHGRLIPEANAATAVSDEKEPPTAIAVTTSHEPKVVRKPAGVPTARAERDRVEAVFRYGASRGRERLAADMLAYSEWDAPTIMAHLSLLPSDEEMDRRRAAGRQADAAAIWDKAMIENSDSLRAPSPAAQAVWDKAIANIYGTKGQ